jgi:hypothetical protein
MSTQRLRCGRRIAVDIKRQVSSKNTTLVTRGDDIIRTNSVGDTQSPDSICGAKWPLAEHKACHTRNPEQHL